MPYYKVVAGIAPNLGDLRPWQKLYVDASTNRRISNIQCFRDVQSHGNGLLIMCDRVARSVFQCQVGQLLGAFASFIIYNPFTFQLIGLVSIAVTARFKMGLSLCGPMARRNTCLLGCKTHFNSWLSVTAQSFGRNSMVDRCHMALDNGLRSLATIAWRRAWLLTDVLRFLFLSIEPLNSLFPCMGNDLKRLTFWYIHLSSSSLS